jgi:hypothetical protein
VFSEEDMERNSANREMNILINLGSFLLCEALGRLLDNELEGYHVLATNLADKTDSFLPDKILVDASTISQGMAIRWPDAKRSYLSIPALTKRLSSTFSFPINWTE